jgi:hypothetical protein
MRDATIHLGNKILFFLRTRPISGIVQRGSIKGETTVKKAALLTLALLTVSYPVLAKSHHDHHHSARKSRHDHHHAVRKSQQTHHSVATDPHSQVTCEMVRSYVAQVGLEQAKAMALSANISVSDRKERNDVWEEVPRLNWPMSRALSPPALSEPAAFEELPRGDIPTPQEATAIFRFLTRANRTPAPSL